MSGKVYIVMMCKKYYYYVLVFTEEGGKFVTELTGRNECRWSAEEKPKAFTKTIADEIAVGLTCNFHPAVMVASAWEIEKQYLAIKDEEETK